MKLAIKRLIQCVGDELVEFVYPKKCLHCHVRMPHETPFLCEGCSTLLMPLEPSERCPSCFNEHFSSNKSRCQNCVENTSYYYRIGAAFEYQGPAATIIKKFKYQNQPYLASGIAALLMTQWERLSWPVPDAIIPVPISFTHWLSRGYNQSELIALELGRLLHVPILRGLKRKCGDFSQAGLNLDQRQELKRNSFVLNKKCNFQDKNLLIIDDVITSGTTLRKCGEVLVEGCPRSLYGLAFCMA